MSGGEEHTPTTSTDVMIEAHGMIEPQGMLDDSHADFEIPTHQEPSTKRVSEGVTLREVPASIRPALVKPSLDLKPTGATGAKLFGANDIAKIYVERAAGRQDAGDLDGAIEDYTKALDRSPDYALARYNRGVARLALDQMELAIEDFARTVALTPQLAEAHYNWAIALLRMGDCPGAADRAMFAMQLFEVRGDRTMAGNAELVRRQALNS